MSEERRSSPAGAAVHQIARKAPETPQKHLNTMQHNNRYVQDSGKRVGEYPKQPVNLC